MERNLTTGSVFKTVVGFSLPFFLSYFLQTLYGMADLFIIGQFCGVESTTAVSVGSQIMHMLTVMIVGLAMGATVMIGRAVGAQDKRQTVGYIGNTVTLLTVLSLALTVVLALCVKPIVAAVATPTEAVAGTEAYLLICFLGVPFITAYNIISSVLRGLGDSKSPMYFIAIACAANIAFDYVFIGALGLGTAGAALGTTLAQTLSVIIALIVIRRSKTGISIKISDLKPDKAAFANILRIGLPVALQDGFVQIAFLIITVIANSRGLNDAAAVGIVEKTIGVLFLVPSSMLSTVSALAAQNVGAKKHDRANSVLRYGIFIAIVWGIMCVIVMELSADGFVGLFTDSGEVVVLGGQYMRGYVMDVILAGVHFCFSGYFCAYGRSGFSFMHNIVSISFARIPLAYLASKMFADTLLPMGIATCTGSAVSVIICVCLYAYMRRKGIGYER